MRFFALKCKSGFFYENLLSCEITASRTTANVQGKSAFESEFFLFVDREGSSEEWELVRSNGEQMMSYLERYDSTHALFGAEEMRRVRSEFERASAVESDGDFEGSTRRMLNSMRATRERVRGLWARFDLNLMRVGATALACALALLLCTVKLPMAWVSVGVVLMASAVVSDTNEKFILLIAQCIAFSWSALVSQLLPHPVRNRPPHLLNPPLLACVVLIPLGLTSNSFVINEDAATAFLLLTAVAWSYASTLSRQLARSAPACKRFTPNNSLHKRAGLLAQLRRASAHKRLLGVLALAGVVRLASRFMVCRPEQHWCYSRALDGDESSLTEQQQQQQTEEASVLYGRLVFHDMVELTFAR